ncbi:eukaryotic translation initiation factor 2D isoform X6 [Felis catus]|uniref:eukaryotic translation initiation factor 2D isoform X6 n=1 Tax=Felis catus TaxID=9685 RepID=UPI001D1A2815|nr:eukaryotic translation initiation factor 2D isoform X6 [Felis catus]
MFAKAFRVKSNTAIKGSDRRKLRADVMAAFPTLGTDQVSVLVPGKEELNIVKLYAHRGDAVTVYVSGGNPILFEVEKTLYPTDLMLPGLVVPPAGLPQVQKGDLCAIALLGNRRSGDKSSPPSLAPLALDPPDLSEEKESVQADPALQGDLRRLTLEGEEENGEVQRMCGEKSLSEASEDPSVRGLNPDPTDSKTLQEQMDELVQRCFLHALKCQVRKADLPLLTSTFLGSHMLSCCPEGRQLDIKKSSYKKLSKFLQHMQQEQIIQVKELSKGVESIVAVDWKHPRITSFVIAEPSPTSQTIQEGSREQPYHPPDIKSLYCVPASMTLLFQESGHKKGSILEGGEVRTIIINYVKRNDLVDADNKNLVKLDPILCDCILEKNEQHTIMKLPWDSLLTRSKLKIMYIRSLQTTAHEPDLTRYLYFLEYSHTHLFICLEKLQPVYQVTFPGQEPIVKKGRICPIDITLAQRASNKKVTVVRNLEAYGLDPCSVAAILQQRCQASATVTPAPGAKDSLQVQIQGNQVHHLSRLLLEEYQLPRKHIQGLEKAPKPGKKK